MWLVHYIIQKASFDMQKFQMVNPFKSVTSEGSKARSVRDMVRKHIIREMGAQRHNNKKRDR